MKLENYFLKVIRLLREQEEILLFNNIQKIAPDQAKEAVDYLAAEYHQERSSYPYAAPSYDREAALWGAHTIYLAAQLLLYREHKEVELDNILLPYNGQLTAAAILSADLCLRFLPAILDKLKEIDGEDRLVQIVENILQKWHYSGIRVATKVEALDFSVVSSNACLLQMYCNRVLDCKHKKLANHPALKKMINANLGMHAGILVKGFNLN